MSRPRRPPQEEPEPSEEPGKGLARVSHIDRRTGRAAGSESTGPARGPAGRRPSRLLPKLTAEQRKAPTRVSLYEQGKLAVRDLDDEELARRRFRDRGGSFSGSAPALTESQHREFTAELIRRGERTWYRFAPTAIATVVEIMTNQMMDPAVRLRASQIILDRAYGKVPEIVRAEVRSKWDETFDAAMDEVWEGEWAESAPPAISG